MSVQDAMIAKQVFNTGPQVWVLIREEQSVGPVLFDVRFCFGSGVLTK